MCRRRNLFEFRLRHKSKRVKPILRLVTNGYEQLRERKYEKAAIGRVTSKGKGNEARIGNV